jgi:iron-sulfur cluster repair protein YtfE (RIC family)
MGAKQAPVLESARPTELSAVLEAMEAEHAELSAELAEWSQAAADVASGICGGSLFPMISQLRDQSSAFLQKLEEHLQRGRHELFPLVGMYAGADLAPSMNPSLWGLDKNYELASRYVRSFQQAVQEAGEEIDLEVGRELVTHLQQASLILHDYLAMEQNLLFPLAEDLLTDIDYLFS